MKRRVLFSFLIIAMAMAAITGGTLAWFTAEADVVSTFTAGTVVVGNESVSVIGTDTSGNWNPGDETELEFTIENTGTKSVFLRASLDGTWGDVDLDAKDPVTFDLSVAGGTFDPDAWTQGGDYFYYNGPIEAGETVVIRVIVTFDGPGADNDFQGQTYDLTATFDAIQSSNDAEQDAWGVEWDGSAWDFTPIP